MAAATAPATATKLAVAVYVEEAAGAPVGAETEEGVTADGVTAEGALAAGASVGGAGGDAMGDGDAAVGGVATGAGAVAGDLAGGPGSGAILGAGNGGRSRGLGGGPDRERGDDGGDYGEASHGFPAWKREFSSAWKPRSCELECEKMPMNCVAKTMGGSRFL
ncbi:hypothetical protein OsJ_09711 [Oryza sativa Japonica Group]|uniref:Uncharacterized protein n=1 Tax=Oryza sativa subsp. japonica TaxID=39947 RepID=A3AEY5_ORYSJ|nr:hypothetical protein OsJ_09711 [Oryza sativa Japonica Group]